MKGLREDVEAMFAELNGYDAYESAIYNAGERARAAAVERTRQWRKDNPEKHRANAKRYHKAYDRAHPEKRKERERRRVARNREKMRATWRRNAKRSRDRKRALQASRHG